MEEKTGKSMGRVITCSMSREDVERDCIEWAKEIAAAYQPDLLIFIAKSGFLFARPMASIFHCRIAEIAASRPQSETKDRAAHIIRHIPEKIILAMLSSPLAYRFHERKGERKVKVSGGFLREAGKPHQRILLVDDSVDTGWTIYHVEKIIRDYFPQTELKTASYALIEDSRKRIEVDFYRHKNKIILTATSRKSKQYAGFLRDYEDWSGKDEKGSEETNKIPHRDMVWGRRF